MAVISNIFYNLVPWAANTASVVNTCVASNGIAWRALTAGNNGANAPSGANATFNDGNVNWKRLALIDYTSLPSWGAALPATLTNAVEARLWNTGEIVFTANSDCFIYKNNAIVTSITNTITITTAPGESFADNPNVQTNQLTYKPSNGVAIAFIVDYATAFDCGGSDNIIIKNIQINRGPHGGIFNGAHNCVFANCILVEDKNSGNDSALYLTDNSVVKNCIFFTTGSRLMAGFNDNVSVINNVFLAGLYGDPNDETTAACGTYYGNMTFTNNLCVNFSYGIVGQNANSTNNAFFNCGPRPVPANSKILTVFDSTVVKSGTGTDYTKLDFRLVAGSPLVNSGAITALLNPSVDIAYTARPQGGDFDIGAWELKIAQVIAARASVFIIS